MERSAPQPHRRPFSPWSRRLGTASVAVLESPTETHLIYLLLNISATFFEIIQYIGVAEEIRNIINTLLKHSSLGPCWSPSPRQLSRSFPLTPPLITSNSLLTLCFVHTFHSNNKSFCRTLFIHLILGRLEQLRSKVTAILFSLDPGSHRTLIRYIQVNFIPMVIITYAITFH